METENEAHESEAIFQVIYTVMIRISTTNSD